MLTTRSQYQYLIYGSLRRYDTLCRTLPINVLLYLILHKLPALCLSLGEVPRYDVLHWLSADNVGNGIVLRREQQLRGLVLDDVLVIDYGSCHTTPIHCSS